MQKTDNLFINTITFDYPKEKLKFYFSLEDRDDAHYTRLYRSNFPKEIKSVFPGLTDATEFIYTTFTYRVDGLVSLSIDLKNESPDFVKQYYNDQVRYYFRKYDRQLIKPTFIRDNQIWLRSKSDDTPQYFVYEKYTIKVGIAKISQFPELTITYDGKSKLLKINTIELVKDRLNADLSIEGVVFTMYDARTNLSLQVVENVKDNLNQTIYKTIIPRNIRLAEAPSYGMPINLYDPKSTGAESYKLLAEEVIRKGEDD